jgi:spermidine synthase
MADDGFRYVRETAHRYDIIFIDAFSEEVMPAHMNTCQFFVSLCHILNDDGCLATNCNLPTATSYNQLLRGLVSTFACNILLADTNVMENARVIISGNQSSMESIGSKELAVEAAEKLQMDVHLEFSLSCLIARAYRCLINDNNAE